MRLVVVGPYPIDPERIRNGVEAVVVYLLAELKKIDGLSINVISCDKGIRSQEMRDFGNIRVHYLSGTRHLGNISFDIVDKLRTVKKIKELSPDIIHVHNHANYPYIVSTPYCPIITTVHGVIYREDVFKNEPLDWIRKIPRKLLERVVLKKASHIISVTSYVSDMIQRFTRGKIRVLENPVSDRYFQIVSDEIPDRILFVGSIMRRKNIIGLVKAMRILKEKVKEVELRVAGGIQERNYYEMVKNCIQENDLANNVKFLWQLSDDDLLREYASCSVVASLSFEETSGMVVQQAMACGKASVASRNGGFSCILRDGKTGFLVDSKDIEGCAEKLHSLITDKELRVNLGQSAKREALNRFKAEVVAKQTYAIYQEVLENVSAKWD